MAPRYLTPSANDGSVKVLQLTDCHLFADKNKDLLGVNTYKSFDAVLNAIKAQNFDYDFIAFTGDISQDYSVLQSSSVFLENQFFSFLVTMMMVL